jgi:IS5 family transposase
MEPCTASGLTASTGQERPCTALTEWVKASIRSKVEHVFRVVKCQFGYRKVRHRGLAKNGAQMTTLYALVSLRLVRRKFLTL